MALDAQTVDNIRHIVDDACVNRRTGLPGATVVVVGRDGNELFAHSAGARGLGSEPLTLEHVFWIASCTKMITGMACMQLVERGVLKLDDGEHLESLCPELKAAKVLEPGGGLTSKDKPITLRMLLTHTAGFGYTFSNDRLRKWSLPAGIDEFSGRFQDMLMPLLFQPGEGWEYGINIDWAGIALERACESSLNRYIQRNILEPLGLANTSMMPTSQMRSKLVYMHARDAKGNLTTREHLLRAPLTIDPSKAAEATVCYSGGAGMFAKPQEYCRLLAVLLNDGACPLTGTRLLLKETVDEMFRNQIPDFPNYGRQGIAAAKPDLTNPVAELYPVAGNPPQGWGLTFMLSGGATGRSAGTGHWAGLPNLWWWCDRDKGVAGIVCTQVLPFGDAQVLDLWVKVESEVYKGLERTDALDS
ncbi:Acyltransferase LovD [Tolypocladium paradoxum]|uniref:Acyltransferase LovD n=1 Tax=Tolypocladium paradoxum TaxID=94208 RepID=A0A2S4KW40_9HYPO|nr:Acyltransferase LovD [Tolypocladium paradoxum]